MAVVVISLVQECGSAPVIVSIPTLDQILHGKPVQASSSHHGSSNMDTNREATRTPSLLDVLESWTPPSPGRHVQDIDHHKSVNMAAPRVVQRPKGKSRCTPQTKQVTFQLQEGCDVNGEKSIKLAVQSCGGSCSSKTELQAVPVSEHSQDADFSDFFTKQKCKCCKAKTIEYKSVDALCYGRRQTFKVASATSCGCKKCR